MKKFILLSAAVFAFSADYIVGGAIGRSIVTNSPIEDYNTFNLRVGKYLPKNHILRFEFDKSERVNKEMTKLLVNVEHYFNVSEKIKPYGFIGGGYQWVSSNYDDNFVGDVGAGLKCAVSKKIDAFIEARALRDFENNDNHFTGLIGLVYKIGEKKLPPKDSDGDGVIDRDDFCPNTPKGVRVDNRGCAIDSDKDGVADYLDKCPNTPSGVKVDKNGCPLDSDKDGVVDYLDKCPNTPKGFEVDKNGCAITYNFEINFDNNSAKIKPEYLDKIKKFAEFLKNHPKVKAEIQGYTDNRGNSKYNIILSQKRAKAVYEALIDLGVSKDRLSFVGYGEENPIALNDTSEGRAKNRRVVAKLYF